jgi:hypothetical protein
MAGNTNDKTGLKANSNDVLAKAQANLLLELPNIGHGLALCNENLSPWGELCQSIE